MNHSINILLWITYTSFTLLYVNVNGICGGFDAGNAGVCTDCGVQSTCENNMYNPGIDGCGCLWLGPSYSPLCVDITCDPTIDPTIDPTADPTVNPTVNPSETPSNSPSKLPSNSPSKSPSKLPSTLQFTQILTIVFSGNYTDFKQYATEQNISLNEAAKPIIQAILQASAGLVDPDLAVNLANIIITVINTFESSIGIEFSVTGDESIIDEADNVFQDAIDNNIEISVGPLMLTPLSVKTETATTITTITPSNMPSKSPNYNSESSSSEGSDSVDINTANQISDLSDQNNMKRNYETDLTIDVSNKTFMLVWCILIGMFITGLYAYCVNYKNY